MNYYDEKPTVRVFPNGWRNYVGLTKYSCRKIGVPINSIVLTQDCNGSGMVYTPDGHGGYGETPYRVNCKPTHIEDVLIDYFIEED